MSPLFVVLLILNVCARTTGYVVLTPPQNYTVFENNTPAVFYCTGYGYAITWYLNGTAYNAIYAQMGIRIVPATPTGGVVSSTLYIPSNFINNNTEVFCKVIDATFTYTQTSGPANLTIQGPLDAPYNFSVVVMSTSLTLSWGAPFSLDVTDYSPDIFSYTLCTNITIYGCKTIPSDPDCTFPRTCTSSVDFTNPSLNGTNGEQNKTIMDPILFTFFANNGAGSGNMAEILFTYHDTDSRIQVSPSTTETERSTVSTISYSKSDLSIGAVPIGLISGAAVIVVLSLVIATIVAITCSFVKRKTQYEHNNELILAGAYNYYSTQQTHRQEEDPYMYFLPLSDFRPTTSQDQKTEAALSVPVAQPSEQISSTLLHVPNYDNVVYPAELNKLEQTEPPKHTNEAYSNPSSNGGSRIECDEYDEDVFYTEAPNVPVIQHDTSEHISSTPTLYGNVVLDPAELKTFEPSEPPMHTHEAPSVPVAPPSEQISSTPPPKYDNVVSPAESNKLEQAEPPMHMNEVEDRVMDSTIDMPQAYSVLSGIRIGCDGDVREESKDLVKDDIQAYSYPSTKRSRIDCDGDGEYDASSVPVIQPSEQISSTPPPKCDNVVSPAESNKKKPSEPPMPMNEVHVEKETKEKEYPHSSKRRNQPHCRIQCGDDSKLVPEHFIEKEATQAQFLYFVKTKCDGRGNRTALQTFEDCKQVDVHNWVQELIIVMIATTTQLFSSEFYVLLVFLMCICLCAFVKRKSQCEPIITTNSYITEPIYGEYITRHIFQWSGFIATTCTSLGADRSHIESDQSNQEQSKHKVSTSASHDGSQCRQQYITEDDGDKENAPIVPVMQHDASVHISSSYVVLDSAELKKCKPSELLMHTNELTSSHPNLCQQCTESDEDDESAYLPSSNRSQHLRRIECGDDENVEEEIKDVEKDDIPETCSYPSTKRSQHLCGRRTECDGDDEDVEGTTKDKMKKDKLQVSSSASHDSSQCQQCTEYNGDNENDWCKNTTTEKEATVPQQFTSGVLKQKTNTPVISEVIKSDDNSWCVNKSLTHEHIEGHTLTTSKEANISDDASSNDEGRIVDDVNNIRPPYAIRSRADLEPFLAAGVGIKDHPQRYVSTGLAGNPIKPIRFSLEDMFQNDKEVIGNAIKDGLDDVHWTRPLTVLILCAVMARRLIYLLLLISGNIEGKDAVKHLIYLLLLISGNIEGKVVSRYLNIINEKKVKDQAKAWKTYIQAVKAIGEEGVIFWLPLDVAYGAFDVQALYAKDKQRI